MKLLLCSDFSNVGYKWLDKFFDLSQKHKCLFVGYASEDKDFSSLNSSAAQRLKDLNFEVVNLDKDYDFCEKIDLIFVRGGNTTGLLHYLRLFNQFDKIGEMVKNGTVFVGQSAGAIIAGTDSEFTLKSEPYEVDLKQHFGADALKGYGWINKLVFVHCSRYRMARDYEKQNSDDEFRTLDTDCYYAYLSDVRHFSKNEFVKIGNNQALMVDGDKTKMLTFDWKYLEVKK